MSLLSGSTVGGLDNIGGDLDFYGGGAELFTGVAVQAVQVWFKR